MTVEGGNEDWKAKYAYMAADFENLKKRAKKDVAEAGGKAVDGFVLKQLGVVDDMERLMHEVEQDELLDQLTGVHAGFEMIYENQLKVLADAGYERIECEETMPFDVGTMEAVSSEPYDKADELTRKYWDRGSVYRVLRAGWRRKDGRVVRHAQVQVLV